MNYPRQRNVLNYLPQLNGLFGCATPRRTRGRMATTRLRACSRSTGRISPSFWTKNSAARSNVDAELVDKKKQFKKALRPQKEIKIEKRKKPIKKGFFGNLVKFGI
jgi:hypothetical protein